MAMIEDNYRFPPALSLIEVGEGVGGRLGGIHNSCIGCASLEGGD